MAAAGAAGGAMVKRAFHASPFLLTALVLAASACRKDDRPERWMKTSEASADLLEQGRYREALAPAQDAAKLAEETFGPRDLRTAYALDHLGKVRRRNGELEEARELFERAVGISAEVLDPDAPKRAHFLDDLAELLAAQGNFDESEERYQRSLRLMQRNFGEFSPSVSAAYTRLAALYTRWGVYQEAENTLRRVGAINARAGIVDDVWDASADASLCRIYLETDRADLAREACPRSLSVRERFPKNDLDLAQSRTLVGILRLREGRLEEAEGSLSQAVDAYRLNPAADRQGLMEALLGMAELYSVQGRDREAEALFGQLLSQYDNPYARAKARRRAAAHYQRRGKTQQAQALYVQALSDVVQSPKSDKRDLEGLLVDLAEVTASQGHAQDSEALLRRALAADEELNGTSAPSSLNVLAALASAEVSLHRLDRARLCCARMRRIAESFGPEGRRTAFHRLAAVYRTMGRADEAERLEDRADFGDDRP
jgi:tetratricopeptide (TPR) repeat protein